MFSSNPLFVSLVLCCPEAADERRRGRGRLSKGQRRMWPRGRRQNYDIWGSEASNRCQHPPRLKDAPFSSFKNTHSAPWECRSAANVLLSNKQKIPTLNTHRWLAESSRQASNNPVCSVSLCVSQFPPVDLHPPILCVLWSVEPIVFELQEQKRLKLHLHQPWTTVHVCTVCPDRAVPG